MAKKKDKVIKICTEKSILFDQVLNTITKSHLKTASRLRRKVPRIDTLMSTQPVTRPLELAVLAATKWNRGQKLRVKFLNGDSKIHGKIKKYAKKWEKYANIKFRFVSSGFAEIRIGIKIGKDRGSWSYLGTDALTISEKKPTMHFGWFDEDTDDKEYSRTVIHEFGHALGAIHEHQHPRIKIPWNKKAVYKYYMGPPNNWKKADVDRNMFQKYSENITNFSKPDKKSIMLYAIPNSLTVGNFQVGWNTELSKTDKKFIKKLYPF